MFAERDVAHAIGSRLFEIPLRDYAANLWYGGAYRGETPAAIVRTRGTDAVAHCLAFATMHLGQRVVDSAIRGYDLVGRGEDGRGTSRLGGLFATHLIDRLGASMRDDPDGIGFRAHRREFEASQTQFRGVAEIMYPDSREMRAGSEGIERETIGYWQRALDHALFVDVARAGEAAIDPSISLVAAICDALDSFYVYVIATLYGADVYEKYGI